MDEREGRTERGTGRKGGLLTIMLTFLLLTLTESGCNKMTCSSCRTLSCYVWYVSLPPSLPLSLPPLFLPPLSSPSYTFLPHRS